MQGKKKKIHRPLQTWVGEASASSGLRSISLSIWILKVAAMSVSVRMIKGAWGRVWRKKTVKWMEKPPTRGRMLQVMWPCVKTRCVLSGLGPKATKEKPPQKPIQVTSIAGFSRSKQPPLKKVMCKLRGNYDHNAEQPTTKPAASRKERQEVQESPSASHCFIWSHLQAAI